MRLPLFINLLLLYHFGQAQVLTNDNGSITITNGCNLTVKGDILNQINGSITNNGTIDLSGNWVNNASNNCFGTSAGTVILNGNNQNIGGSNSTTFNNLILVGTGTKTLFVNTVTGGSYATPSGVLSLNDRPLILNSNMLTVANPSTAAITRTSGFIESETTPLSGYGILKWNTGNIVAGNNYIFPFGTTVSNTFIPVIYQVTSPGTGSSGFIAVATFPTLTSANPNNRPLPTGLTSLMNATSGLDNSVNTIDRYWVMDVQNYTTLPVSTLSLSYRDSEWDLSGGSTNTIVESQLQAQFNNGSIWSFPSVGIVNTITNMVTVSNVNTYNNIWTLVGSNAPLPVELLSFEAHPIANKFVECNWVTASEINNDYFVVEKSRDGSNFVEIGIVKGAGNSSQLLTYEFTDVTPFEGLSYYRLKQIDYDGSFTYSQIVPVNIYTDKQPVSIFPNPASEFITITFMIENDEPVEFIITDINGKICYQRNLYLTKGMNAVTCDIALFSEGVYFMKVVTGNDILTTKLIKNKVK